MRAPPQCSLCPCPQWRPLLAHLLELADAIERTKRDNLRKSQLKVYPPLTLLTIAHPLLPPPQELADAMDQADGADGGDGGCGEGGCWGSPSGGSDSGAGLAEGGDGGGYYHRSGGSRRSAAAARASSKRLLVPDARRGTLQLLVSRQDSCLVKLRWYEREPEGTQRYR